MKILADTSLSLHSKQKQALFADGTELLFGGAAGPGKSHLLRVAAIYWCQRVPGLQAYLFRRLSIDLVSNHLEGPTGLPAMLAPLIESGDVRINYSSNAIYFSNGSAIFLRHCQYEQDKIKSQGQELHLLLIDEATHFTESIYRYLRGRVRLGGLTVPDRYKPFLPRIICATNPGGVGHNWVKSSFIDIAPPFLVTQMPAAEGGFKRQFIPALLSDNPTMMANDPDYADRLSGLGDPTLVRAMLSGDWDIVAGGMFDDVWDRERQLIPAFPIPPGWVIDRSFDWGDSKPFAVCWWAEADGTEAILEDGTPWCPPRGTLVLVDEWYGWSGKPNEGCRMLASDIAKGIKTREDELQASGRISGPVLPGPADTSIFDVENGHSIAADMEAEGVLWARADKRPGSRVNGWQRLRRLLAASTKRPMEEPGLFAFDHCIHFARTLPVLPRDQRKADDVDTEAEDHCFRGDTRVITDRGPVAIKDLVGTRGRVLSVGGRFEAFQGCRLTRKDAPTVEVVFEDGSSVVCTPDHRFLTSVGLERE